MQRDGTQSERTIWRRVLIVLRRLIVLCHLTPWDETRQTFRLPQRHQVLTNVALTPSPVFVLRSSCQSFKPAFALSWLPGRSAYGFFWLRAYTVCALPWRKYTKHNESPIEPVDKPRQACLVLYWLNERVNFHSTREEIQTHSNNSNLILA